MKYKTCKECKLEVPVECENLSEFLEYMWGKWKPTCIMLFAAAIIVVGITYDKLSYLEVRNHCDEYCTQVFLGNPEFINRINPSYWMNKSNITNDLIQVGSWE